MRGVEAPEVRMGAGRGSGTGRVRRALIALTAAALLLTGAAPAAPPDFPVAFVSVDELKALGDRKERAVIIDVRTRPEYDALRIAGARSIPLRSMRERATEVPRSGLVVLY
jgi:hypothetical protein